MYDSDRQVRLIKPAFIPFSFLAFLLTPKAKRNPVHLGEKSSLEQHLFRASFTLASLTVNYNFLDRFFANDLSMHLYQLTCLLIFHSTRALFNEEKLSRIKGLPAYLSYPSCISVKKLANGVYMKNKTLASTKPCHPFVMEGWSPSQPTGHCFCFCFFN